MNKPFQFITLYARKEPTTDAVAIAHGEADRQDVCLYGDKGCTDLKARWAWHVSGIPTKRNKRITYNCFTYNIEWA
jgi:hypothetical protein